MRRSIRRSNRSVEARKKRDLLSDDELFRIREGEIPEILTHLHSLLRKGTTSQLKSAFLLHKWKLDLVVKEFSKINKNQNEFMEWLGNELGFRHKEDWYDITEKVISQMGGDHFLAKYHYSPSKLVISTFPDHPWSKWRFRTEHKSKEFWKMKDNQKEFVDWLGIQLGFKHLEDWYKISWQDFWNHGGGILLNKHKGSPSRLVISVYPNHPWDRKNFRIASQEDLNNVQNQKELLNQIGIHLGLRKMEDWYQVLAKDIGDKGGVYLLGKYRYSLTKLVTSLFPEHNWIVWKFVYFWRGFDLTMAQKQRIFMDWIGNSLGLKNKEDWYMVNVNHISKDREGCRLLAKHQGSLSKLIMSTYPNHEWKVSQFDDSSKEFWNRKENQREFMELVGLHDGFKQRTDWYGISAEHIRLKGGEALLQIYQGPSSIPALIKSTFPEHEWQPDMFRSQ